MSTKKDLIICIGSVYVETNYLGLVTGNSTSLQVGKEYRAPKWETRLGGSVVNFAVQAKRLGSETVLIGKTGNDEAGKKLIELLKKEGISIDLINVSRDEDIQTSVDAGLVFENGTNIQVVAGNANQELSLNDIDLNSPFFKSATAVYLGGFLKQLKLYPDYPLLLKKLSELGTKIFLDHGRIPIDVTDEQRDILKQSLKYLEVYLPNKDELIGITGNQNLSEALEEVLQLGPKVIAVKLGSEGCIIKTKNADIVIPGSSVRAISTVGAGDAFNAGFITQYLSGKPLKKAGEFANATATIRVSKNKNPNLVEVENYLNDNHR